MVSHQRFMVTEVSITQAIHHSITQTIESSGGARLWNTDAAPARAAKRGNSRNSNWASQGAGAAGPVNGHAPELHCRTGYAHQQVWRASRWQCRTFEISRHQTD